MDDLIKSIKKKLSAENLVEMMKDAQVIDNKRIKEEDVRRTLENMDTNNLIDVTELAAKLNQISEEAAAREVAKNSAKPSPFTVLSKGNEKVVEEEPKPEESEHDYMIHDNVTGFLD